MPTVRYTFCLVASLLISWGFANEIKSGKFTMALQKDNAFLPASIRWNGMELIHPQKGLDHDFTSFEFRSKIYRNENKHAWGQRQSPRFVTDVKLAKRTALPTTGHQGLQVDYQSSYAQVQRRIFLHSSENSIRIEYHFTAMRDIVVHETQRFGVSVRLDSAFGQMTIADMRSSKPGTVMVNVGRPSFRMSFLNPGPMLFTNSAKGTNLLVTTSCTGLTAPVPLQLLRIAKGQAFTLTAALALASAEDRSIIQKMWASPKGAATSRPVNLVLVANVLCQNDKADEAEEALLLAAKLDPTFAEPYAQLAALRRDNALPGQNAAWAEAGWRNPYNYGYMLSASSIVNDKKLTEAQRRQAIFNMLIAVENAAFYPDYYVWAARGFISRRMYAQACAQYRQALWAVKHMPRPEAFKEKLRTRFEKKIKELEGKMLNKTHTSLPAPIPTRKAQK